MEEQVECVCSVAEKHSGVTNFDELYFDFSPSRIRGQTCKYKTTGTKKPSVALDFFYIYIYIFTTESVL